MLDAIKTIGGHLAAPWLISTIIAAIFYDYTAGG